MKGIVLISFLLLSTRGFALCLPGSLDISKSNRDMSEFEFMAEDFRQTVKPLLSSDQSLVINFDSLNPRVNAEITRVQNHLIIDVMGGMLHHPAMNLNAFKLLLCHEWGHFKGGPPFKARGGWSSTEGQADYYSGNQCSRQLSMDEISVIEGALALTKIYAQVTREVEPTVDQCDERRVQRINFGYPSVQCRLDTILAGWKNEPRPSCWFIE